MKIPVQELKFRITEEEFLDWIEYLNDEWDRFDKLDWYLARISMTTAQANSTSPNKYKLDDFKPKPVAQKRRRQNPMEVMQGMVSYFANRRVHVEFEERGNERK